MRHARAEPRPVPDPGGDPLLGVRSLAYGGATVGLIGLGFFVSRTVRLPEGVYLGLVATSATLYHGVMLWLQLDDSDVAHADRGGRSWKARMRNRLRAWLGIRHV